MSFIHCACIHTNSVTLSDWVGYMSGYVYTNHYNNIIYNNKLFLLQLELKYLIL